MWREIKKAAENQTHTRARVIACVELCSWRESYGGRDARIGKCVNGEQCISGFSV